VTPCPQSNGHNSTQTGLGCNANGGKGKNLRALEKLRKTALKSLESVDVNDYLPQDTRTALVQLLDGIIGLLEKVSQVASFNPLLSGQTLIQDENSICAPHFSLVLLTLYPL
jgi:hypothetical protein